MADIKPLRLCNNCGYCCMDGYEYPEYYCGAGVDDDDPLLVGDGCIYTDRQLKIKQKYIDGEIQKSGHVDPEIFDTPKFSDLFY